MTVKRIAATLVLSAAIVAAPGVANAMPGEPGQCSGTGYCQNIDTPDNGTLDGSSVVWDGPGFWDYARSFVDGVFDTLGWYRP